MAHWSLFWAQHLPPVLIIPLSSSLLSLVIFHPLPYSCTSLFPLRCPWALVKILLISQEKKKHEKGGGGGGGGRRRKKTKRSEERRRKRRRRRRKAKKKRRSLRDGERARGRKRGRKGVFLALRFPSPFSGPSLGFCALSGCSSLPAKRGIGWDCTEQPRRRP